MDDALRKEILRNIHLTGESSKGGTVFVSRNWQDILKLGEPLARIKPHLISKFSLILGQPLALKPLSNLEIRCTLCHKVIGYPCWYYVVRYHINQMHYFVCFDSHSPGKVTARCYRS